MKKVSLLILVSMILLLAFASCDQLPPLFGEEPEPEHVHDWMEATCEAPKTCACGATEGEKLPHTWTEATCSSPKVCTFCNATEGTALNHKWVSADCETPATCSLCGETSGEAQGHSWISASCDSAKHCANCNMVEGEPLEHVWEEATCLTPKTCTLCQATDGPALGHTNETVPGFAATCTENGLTDGTVCTVCGVTTLAQQIIPAPGHTASEWIEDLAPNCTENGSKHKECTVCGTLLDTVALPALGHTESDWIIDLEATCDEKGSKHKECTVCGTTTKVAAIPVEGHVEAAPVVENNVAPDCENAGSYEEVVYCATCGDELARNTVPVPALGHKMSTATCQAPATCSVCGHIEGTVAACKAGETQKENEVAPRCEVPGSYDLATYCVWCNTELSRETVPVDALEHDMAPATCQAPATCKNGCGKTEGQPLDQHTIVVDTMSEDFLYYVCATCDKYYVADKALVYDGSKLPQLAKNGDPTIKVNANGEYEVFAGAEKSQYMLYFPSNSKGNASMFTDFTGAKNSVGVLSFKVKPNTLTDSLRVIVMTARDNPNWDANGSWNGNSMDIMSMAPNGDGTWSVNGKNITNNVFATVSANDWVDVKMFMQLTSDGMFNISYYVNGEFCNVYSRDLLNAGSAQTIKDLSIQCVYICGWTEAGTGFYFDDLAFGYANDAEWAFDDHKHTWADANCTAPKTCTACGITEGEALGHELVDHAAQAPTCTEKGWDAYQTCNRCDYSSYKELAATGHNYGSATCDQAASCSVCGFSSGSALGHEFVDYKYNNDAKCELDGTKTAKCIRCDVTDTKTAEGTALQHNWASANCASPSTCTLCGKTGGEPDKALHTDLTVTANGSLATYACSACGYSFKTEVGDFMDGTHYNGMGVNASGNGKYYTSNPDKANYPVLNNGYYEYVRNEVEAGTQAQLQVWLPTPSAGTNKFAGFSAANHATGYLSFSINAYTDHNLEMKLVDNRVDNLDLNGDGTAESIRWSDAWAINDPVFRVLPPSGGKAQLVGFNNLVIATVDVDENNYTGWVDVAIQLVLDPTSDQVIATYYVNGAYAGTSARPLTTHTDAIQSVYINSNNKAAGTGYKIDNIAFGYTAHKHNISSAIANGILTYSCECGASYRIEEFHDWDGDGSDSPIKNVPNGNVTLNVNDKGQYEYIFKPATDVAPDFSAAGTQQADGWYEYTDKGYAGGQLQMWMPSNNRDTDTFADFSCENNAVGVISFKVKSSLTRHPDWDTSLTFSVGKPRNAGDWNDGGSWNDDSINVFTIEDTLANGATVKGGLNGTNINFGVIPAGEDGWTEWFNVMMVIEMTDDGYLTIYYYINSQFVGSDSRDLNNPAGNRTLNPKKIEALQISGWTYAANTGIVFDDFYFGYTVQGHNTLDGHVHNVTEGATCADKSICSCGWEGYTTDHDFAEATCGAPATCKGCGMTKGEALTHDSLTVQVDGENVKYYCADCNKYYVLDGGMHDMGDISDPGHAGYVKEYDGKVLSFINDGTANAQHQIWVPGQTVSPDLAGFTNANNATGFLSFTVNTKDNHNTGVEFKVNANRGTGNWGGPTNNGWSESSVGVFKIFPHGENDTTVKIGGYNGATLGNWTMTGTDGWTGEMNVVIKIQLKSDNTVDIDYYINGEYFANVKADMVIWTYDISSLYVNGRTNVAGEGYILSNLYFGYTLSGLHDAPVVEEPFYNEVIDAANVQSETLKTIVASKIKQCDQANPSGKEDDLFAEGGTPVYVLADKNGETVEALYFSRTVAWTGKETKQLFTEFRFDVDGTKKATSISFDYKIKGTVEKNDRFTFTDLEGNKFSADAYVQIKTPANHPLAGDNYPELQGTDLILDGEWHTMTYTFAEPLEIINVLVNLYKFQGQLLISNFNVEFEQPVVEEPFYNEVIDAANVQSETLKTIVASKIKQCDQSNPGSDPSKDLFAEGGTPVYVLADNNGETVEALYISRSVAWLGTEAAHFTEFRFAINGEKEGPAVTSISFDYKIKGTVAKNERYEFTDFDGTKFYSDAYVQVKTISKAADVIEQAGDNYPELAGTDLVLDGEWHTFTYNFATPRYLIDFLLNLYQFQGELLIANIEIEYYEEPFYTEEIAKESVSSSVLQTVVTNKIKQWDQSSAHNSHEGTPVFVKADMNGTEVTGVYFSKTTPWVGDEGEQFSEFRVNVDSSKKAAGFSFVYKVEGTVDENKGKAEGGYDFKDLEGNVFTADAYVQIKTPSNHPLAGDNYPELSGTDFILDGEWHTMTYTFATPLEITNMLFNFYHFQGELIIAELEVTFVEECQHTNTTTTKVDATCSAEGSNKVVCNDCGETLVDEVLPVVAHNMLYRVEGEGVVVSCAYECGEGYSIDKGYYTPGTDASLLTPLAGNYSAGFTSIANGRPEVSEDGYLVFARKEGYTGLGQVQLHYRAAAWNESNSYFPNFSAAAGANGVLEFKINPNLDTTGNLRVIVSERVESGFGWGTHSITLLTFHPATDDGKINVTGWGNNALATLEKGEDGYTGWLHIRITIELSVNEKGQNIGLVKYYFNGEHVGTTHSALNSLVNGRINNLYITSNHTEVGTGYMLDDLVFGYSTTVDDHEHSYTESVTAPTCTKAGFTTFTCDCGESYTGNEVAALGHDEKTTTVDATCLTAGSKKVVCNTCGETLVDEVLPATGHTLSTVATDGKVSVVCAGCDRTYACDTSYVYDGANQTWNWSQGATSDISLNVVDGEYVISANSEIPSQYMLYIPSSNRNYAMGGFTGEANAIGVVSFRVKTDAKNYYDENGKLVQPGTVRFILMEARNGNGDWKGWTDNSVDVLAIQPNDDGTYKVHGNSMTSTTLTTIAADEWLDVQMIVRITSAQTMTIDYYLNDTFCGSFTKDFNAENYGMRLVNNLIESLYICGWTQGQGTGVVFDDLYIGYTAFGHWTFDDNVEHVVTEATSCTAPATCTCGWVGDVLPHDMTEASCATPATCKTCGFTTGEALKHNYTTLVNNGTVKYLCEDCMLCYSVETGTLSDGNNPSDNVWKNFTGAGGADFNGNGAYPALVEGADGNKYFQYLKAETTGAKQIQIWLPSSGGKGLQGFTADANNVGFFSLDFNANMDHNCEWKFVDFSSDAARWSAEWCIDNPFFRMTTPADGKVELRGFNGVAFATVELDENNYTGWMNLAFMITLDAEQDLVIVDYYLNGQYKATMSAPLTTKTNGICAVYMNGNAKAEGTGYMVDNIAFGYGSFGTHEHTWTNATCTTAKTCSGCGMVEGTALGHDFDEANCTSPKTCAICDATEGEALGHDMQPATCTSASKCSRCSHTEGEALAHADEDGNYKCDACSTKMLPADGTALTIPQALAIAELGGTAYTTQKYYITGIVTNLYNTQYGNFYIKDAEGNQICIYGLYSADGKTRYDAMSYKPVEGDEVTVYTVLGMYSSTKQGKNAWLDEVVAHDHDYTASVTAPTCVAGGFTTYTCSICSGSYMAEETEALGHTTESGECERCGLTIGGAEPVIGVLATFDFGANGSASHNDGNTAGIGSSKSYTSGSYTLAITNASKVYDGARDAKGNSCLKLGTSSVIGSFKFTVPEEVTEVVIYVAKYKSNTTKISINGAAAQTLTKNSNDGAYDVIVIDTSVNKTVSFATVSGGVRCMINTIEFKGNVG